jgi:hypothetical protein
MSSNKQTKKQKKEAELKEFILNRHIRMAKKYNIELIIRDGELIKKTSTNQEKSSDANRLLAEALITKLQERLKLFPDEDDAGLYDRGLYDGYLNALKIVTDECY